MHFVNMDDWKNQWITILAFLLVEFVMIVAAVPA